MGDDILEALELKNGNMYDYYDSRYGEENEIYDDTYYMYDALEENTKYKLYIWISDTTNGKRDILEGNNVFNFSENG